MPLTRFKKTTRKKRKILLYAFLPLILLLTLFFSLKIASEIRKSIWDGRGRISIVWNTHPVLLTSVSPQEETVTIVLFPNDAYAETEGGYGRYKLTSLWRLGILEKRGGSLLSRTIQTVIGIPVDGWIGESKENWRLSEKISREQIEEFQNELTKPSFLLTILERFKSKNVITNLSSFDLARLWWKLRKIRRDKIIYLNLNKFEVTTNFINPDGAIAKIIDSDLLDNLTREKFEDVNVEKENLSIEIRNAAGKEGLGRKLARILTNIGAQVIKIENEKRGEVSFCFTRKSLLTSYTLKRIKKLANCKIREKNLKETEILVILGKDVLKFL